MICRSHDVALEYRGRFAPSRYPRRYIPDFHFDGTPDAVAEETDTSVYFRGLELPLPESDEHKYLLIRQMLNRLHEERGRYFMDDAVALGNPENGKAVIVFGASHSGKGTVLMLSLEKGLIPLGNETLLLDENGRVLAGADLATVGGDALSRYKITADPDGYTRSGWPLLDLRRYWKGQKPYKVVAAIHIHGSFAPNFLEYNEISVRKLVKLLYPQFSSIIRGIDYLEPYAPNLSTPDLDRQRMNYVKSFAELLAGRAFEAYGSHDLIADLVKTLLC